MSQTNLTGGICINIQHTHSIWNAGHSMFVHVPTHTFTRLSRSFGMQTHTQIFGTLNNGAYITCLLFVFVKFTTNGTSVDHMCTLHCFFPQSGWGSSNSKTHHHFDAHWFRFFIWCDVDDIFSFDDCYFGILLATNFHSVDVVACLHTGRNGGAVDKNCGAKEKRFSFEWLHLYTLKFIK